MNVADEKLAPAYPLAQVARIVGCNATTLRSWVRGRSYKVSGEKKRSQPVFWAASSPGALLTFLDLVEAHMLTVIRKGYGIPLKNFRKATEYLREIGDDCHRLAHRDFVYDRKHFYLKEHEKLISLSERGQHVDPFIIKEGVEQLMYGEDGYAESYFPKINGRQQSVVAITPKIGFGQPALVRLGINIDAVAARFDAGEHMKDLAADYGATLNEIEEAIRSTRELISVR